MDMIRKKKREEGGGKGSDIGTYPGQNRRGRGKCADEELVTVVDARFSG
jgi:hypothetical protein